MFNALSKFGYRQIPSWAHPSHPIMRTVLGRSNRLKWSRRIFLWLILLLVTTAAIAAGYIIAGTTTENTEPTISEILYWPLVGAQTLAMILAIAMTTNAVNIERQKQTWDSLKLSLAGVGLTLRARWAAVFYRLSWLLFVITIGRLVYIGILLDDMTEFQGRALDLRISGITPSVSLDLTVIIISLHMTAFVIQPFVAVALAAAAGLVVSVFMRGRGVMILGLGLLIALRLLITVGSILLGNSVLENIGLGVKPELAEIANENTVDAWYRLILSSAEGDQMLKILNLDTLGQIWADIDYGIYLGAIMLIVVLVEAILANMLVIFAAWRASKPTND
ncbi:MAG: hypothetical protein CUN55_10760 [Phototrophicales bacterium]|nr:MAG: hypothetical protein CUN55_10760 [Phototrophicales bacterium]